MDFRAFPVIPLLLHYRPNSPSTTLVPANQISFWNAIRHCGVDFRLNGGDRAEKRDTSCQLHFPPLQQTFHQPAETRVSTVLLWK